MDRHFEPIQMGLVPEDALGELDPEIEKLPLPSRARRMLRLAAPSFQAVAKDLDGPVPLFIGLPDLTPAEAPWLAHVPAYLQKLTGVHDRSRSAAPSCRTAARRGSWRWSWRMNAIAADPAATVIVGGVDTYLDLRLLATLDAEQRILGQRVMDGFIPGEGAAFCVLSGARATQRTAARRRQRSGVVAWTRAIDMATAPAKGEGLADALAQLRQRAGQLPGPIGTTFAGFNGESFDAKLWGVARLRHNDFFSPTMTDRASGGQVRRCGRRHGRNSAGAGCEIAVDPNPPGPALVWAASDREPRACAVMSVAAH